MSPHPISVLLINQYPMFLVRGFCTTSICRKGKILPALKNATEIGSYLRKPSWNVLDMIPSADHTSQEINKETVQSMLQISGLEWQISEKEMSRWIKTLNTHVAFINHVNDSVGEIEEESESSVFRLLASDHQPPEPLTLQKLLQQVEEVEKHVSDERGERGFDTSRLRTSFNRK